VILLSMAHFRRRHLLLLSLTQRQRRLQIFAFENEFTSSYTVATTITTTSTGHCGLVLTFGIAGITG